MIQLYIGALKVAPLLVAMITMLILGSILIIILSGFKKRKANKTTKLFKDLKHGQQQLVYVLRSNKDLSSKKIACFSYFDSLEIVLNQMMNGGLNNSLYKSLIKPLIIECIAMDEMSQYISEIEKLNRDKTIENNYQNLLKLINEHNNSNIIGLPE